MEVVNQDAYYNSVYSGIIVNADHDSDPDGRYRVQVYIPSLHFQFNDIYEEYMNSSDKALTGNMDKFPWAKTLVKDLKNGNIVYGTFINNRNDEFVILGLDATNPVNDESSGEGMGYDINGSGLLDLAMPIIIHNEVGISPSQWPEGISDAQYTNINPADNGGWSIGLIQWHHGRAYDVLDYIRTKDSNWESYWSDKSLSLYLDLKSGVNSNRNKYQASFHPTSGTPLYNGIKGMLGSSDGKTAQREYASKDTQAALDDLSQNYGITNPAVMIFVADIMNQYGNGIPGTKKAAADACKGKSGTMEGLDAAISAIKGVLGTYSKYQSRRSTTYNYLKELDAQGKFNTAGLTDQGDEGNVVSGNGQYCMPFSGSASISATWGPGRHTGQGGYSNSAHNGVDFSMSQGTPLIACEDGRIEQKTSSGGFGIHTFLYGNDGNLIVYGHQCRHNGGDRQVRKGDIIGYSGNTGNSTGPHLHVGVTKQSTGASGLYNANWSKGMNPLPFFGISGGVGTGLRT